MSSNNNCKNCRQSIAALALGELEASDADELKKHIDDCQSCRSLYHAMAEEEEMIQSAFQAIGNKGQTMAENIIEQFDKQSHQQLSRGWTMSQWPRSSSRTIKQIAKLAAAAVIIIAVLIGINHFGSSIDGAGVAWAQVVKEICNHTKYKCRQRVISKQGLESPKMNIYHLNLQQRRQEVENGDIHIIDMRGEDAITVELHPDRKKAIVTKLLGFGPRKDPDIIDMVKRFEQKSTRKLGTRKQNGKILYGFRHQPNKYNDFTVWVDAQTKLPVEVEIKHPEIGQTIFMDEFEFDFDLEPNAFSTEIPDGYEVETLIQDYRPVEPKEVSAEHILSSLNHTTYTIEKLPWMNKIITIEILDPLGTRAKVYVTGIQSNDGNMIIIVQDNYYDGTRMVWIPKQQIVMEIPGGIKLYTHPNGSIYAQCFLESFAKANPEFFDIKNLSEERFTRMIVMPDGTIMGLSANKQMSDKKLQELVESLVEIKAIK